MGCAPRLTGQSGLAPSQTAALRQRPPATLHTVPATVLQHAPARAAPSGQTAVPGPSPAHTSVQSVQCRHASRATLELHAICRFLESRGA